MSLERSMSLNVDEERHGKKVGITTHILDTSRGQPARNVPVFLYKSQADAWVLLNESKTNSDGRCADLVGEDKKKYVAGRYKIVFKVDQYFESLNVESMYPSIEIIFDVKSPLEHYHVPLLLNPYGFSTYRGS